MIRKATNHILEQIDQGVLDPKTFLESLLQSMSEKEVLDNLEYIQRVEDWPRSMRLESEDE